MWCTGCEGDPVRVSFLFPWRRLPSGSFAFAPVVANAAHPNLLGGPGNRGFGTDPATGVRDGRFKDQVGSRIQAGRLQTYPHETSRSPPGRRGS